MTAPLKVVGADVPRKDAFDKVTGHVSYAVDVALPGMLHAKVLRSSHAHALIQRLDVSRARRAPGVRAVLTHGDIPPEFMAVYGYNIKDQPLVAVDRVRYIGDMICAVAADTEAEAAAALALVEVDYQDLPVAASIEAALAENAVELFPVAPMGVVPAFIGLGGIVYMAVSSILGVVFVWYAYKVFQIREGREADTAARALFGFSILYLFALFLVLLAEHTIRIVMGG